MDEFPLGWHRRNLAVNEGRATLQGWRDRRLRWRFSVLLHQGGMRSLKERIRFVLRQRAHADLGTQPDPQCMESLEIEVPRVLGGFLVPVGPDGGIITIRAVFSMRLEWTH